ncbi:MAG: universal stress protein [Hyphomicrobiales bacterium]|nr:universal stress protein [Hyphomicrobiales bacterium]
MPAARYATRIATRAEAHLTGLAIAAEPIIPPLLVAPVPVDLINESRLDAERKAKDAIGRFEAMAKEAGISVESRFVAALAGSAASVFAAEGRLADLVVIGQDNPDAPEPARGALIEAALFDAGTATLIVPYTGAGRPGISRVMIAWDGSRTSARAVRVALPVLAEADLVRVVIVDQPPSIGGGEPGADVATYLARHGIDVEIDNLPSDGTSVAAVLLDYAADEAIDLLVMGAFGHSRMREFVLGGATRDILRAMTLPVLMAH